MFLTFGRQRPSLDTRPGCPACGIGRLALVLQWPHPRWGMYGHQKRLMECTRCDHSHTEDLAPLRN